jgi:hypothetical protein
MMPAAATIPTAANRDRNGPKSFIVSTRRINADKTGKTTSQNAKHYDGKSKSFHSICRSELLIDQFPFVHDSDHILMRP